MFYSISQTKLCSAVKQRVTTLTTKGAQLFRVYKRCQAVLVWTNHSHLYSPVQKLVLSEPASAILVLALSRSSSHADDNDDYDKEQEEAESQAE